MTIIESLGANRPKIGESVSRGPNDGEEKGQKGKKHTKPVRTHPPDTINPHRFTDFAGRGQHFAQVGKAPYLCINQAHKGNSYSFLYTLYTAYEAEVNPWA